MRYSWRRRLGPLPEREGRSGALDGGDAQPWGASNLPDTVPLDELRDVPVVVVLGERGAGKSVALEQEHQLLERDGAATSLLDLGHQVSDAMSAGHDLAELLCAEGDPVRHLLLDGLDEGMDDIPGLDKALSRQLQRMDPVLRRRLRLRITCRTTRWSGQLEDGLRALWPEPGQVALLTLAPLTTQDVLDAAEQHGLDAVAFAAQVTGRILEPLSQQPVTLIPLLTARERGEELPRTVAEAFDQACRTLCTENWKQGFARRQDRPTVDDLLEVARWTAAALQFGPDSALTDGERALEGELHLDSLAGAAVPGPVPGPPCHRHELLHLTESALLTPVGRRRWVFAHRGYREHLAAQYLQTHVAPSVRDELLWAGSGPARHVLPAHEEVAARLAFDDPALFDDLLAHDPKVLLLADLPALSDEHRARTAQALLDGAADESFDRLDFDLLRRLDHPDLAGQLAPFLVPEADGNQTYLALWIAAKCLPEGRTSVLLSAAENTELPLRFRAFSLDALGDEPVTEASAVTRLRDLAHDTSPAVAEAALAHLSQHLEPAEYFDLLPDQDRWSYRHYMERHFKPVTIENIDAALDWVIKTLRNDARTLIAVALLARCIELVGERDDADGGAGSEPEPPPVGGHTEQGTDDPSCAGQWTNGGEDTDSVAGQGTDEHEEEARVGRTLERTAQALVVLAAHPDLFGLAQSGTSLRRLRDVLTNARALRSRLANRFLNHADGGGQVKQHDHTDEAGQFDVGESAVRIYAAVEVGLFPNEDLLYWAERWMSLPPRSRHAARPLFSRRHRPEDERLCRALDQARLDDPDLRDSTAWWDVPPPDPPWHQHEEERRRGRIFDPVAFGAALDQIQTVGPSQVRDVWLTVLGHLYRTDDGRRAEQSAYLGAVTAAPSCPPPGSDLADDLTRAAERVLAIAPVWTPQDVSTCGTAWQAVPELLAAGFVPAGSWEAAAPATDIGRWAGWALALATMIPPKADRELHREMFERSVRHAGPAFPTVLAACLERLEPYPLAELVKFLHGVGAADAIEAVREWAVHSGRTDETWTAVVVTLTSLGDAEAQTLVRRVLAAGPRPDPESAPELGHVPEPGIASPPKPGPSQEVWMAALLAVMPTPELRQSWSHVRRAFQQDPDTFDALVDRLAALGPGRWPAGVPELDEDDLADLYQRLLTRKELARPRPQHEPDVVYQITMDETLHDLADALPYLMADKETDQAAEHLDRLATSTTIHTAQLRRLARRTIRLAASRRVEPLPLPHLRQLAVDHSLRVIHDETQLLDVVMEALNHVQQALSGPNGLSILLWSRAAAPGGAAMWPMWEEDFSDLIMGLLKIHLGGQRVILNREVQIDRPGAGGSRTDIHIQAADPAGGAEPYTVVVEAKGCWHDKLRTALTDQLVTRYLRRPRTAGVFLVGFFDCDLWQSSERRRCSPSHTLQQIEDEQRRSAAAHLGVHVRAAVLDCRPPGVQTA